MPPFLRLSQPCKEAVLSAYLALLLVMQIFKASRLPPLLCCYTGSNVKRHWLSRLIGPFRVYGSGVFRVSVSIQDLLGSGE